MSKLLIFGIGLMVTSVAVGQAPPLTCPIMGNAVPESAPTVEYRGLEVAFCCAGCDESFLKDPEKHLAAMPEGKVAAVSLFDVVTTQRIDSAKAEHWETYNGIAYPFQSGESHEQFKTMPEVYASAPKRESLVCPVMKSEIASHSKAVAYAEYEEVRYYFCCNGCPETFAADPGKYVKNAVVRPVSAATGSSTTGQHPTSHSSTKATMAPTCAGCAGEARLLSNGELGSRWTFGYRYVAIDDAKARHRMTLDYAVTPRFSIGIERAGGDDQPDPVPAFEDGPLDYLRFSDGDAPIMPRFSWFVTPEGSSAPSVVVGTAADRLSTPRGQAFFATFAKTLGDGSFTPFVSVKWNTFDNKVVYPFGANVRVADNLVLQAMNDGDYSHFLLTKMQDRAAYSLMLARGKHFGFAVSVGF